MFDPFSDLQGLISLSIHFTLGLSVPSDDEGTEAESSSSLTTLATRLMCTTGRLIQRAWINLRQCPFLLIALKYKRSNHSFWQPANALILLVEIPTPIEKTF
jgi:hypothetical protein